MFWMCMSKNKVSRWKIRLIKSIVVFELTFATFLLGGDAIVGLAAWVIVVWFLFPNEL